MKIPTTANIFYPNYLRVLSVLGDRVKVQFSVDWETNDLTANFTINQIVQIRGDLYDKLYQRHGVNPDDIELVSDFLSSQKDELDWYLADDCHVLVGKKIQQALRDTLDNL